jgi:exodeoxyribonuclease-5
MKDTNEQQPNSMENTPAYNNTPIRLELIPEPLRQLPQPVTRSIAKRQELRSIADIKSALTEDQRIMFDEMWAFISDKTRQCHLLAGHAGSGKTTLIVAFVEAYLSKYPRDVAITATTNKAVVVLAGKADFISDRVNYSTIHSLLKLKQQIDDRGNIFFDVPQNGDRYQLSSDIGLIVIDEASMIDKKLHHIIIDRIKDRRVKVIFVGDFYQIPPVGETIALIGTPSIQQELGIQVSMLSKIVRQAAGNPIIQLATFTREHENHRILQYDYKEDITEHGSIIPVDRTNKKKVFEVIRHLIANEHFKDNADYSKVLAWRNKTVDTMNEIIRIMIYGRQAQEHMLLPGEKLIANKPIIDTLTKSVIFSNNAEFEVMKYELDWKDIKGHDCKYFKAWVRQRLYNPVTLEPKDTIEVIDIIHPESKPAFKEAIDELYRIAKSFIGLPQSSWHWRNYYQMMEHFADVKYNYCLTSHKAQGSTFRNAVILEKDIRSNPTMPERNRLLYVAYTRPSTNLILIR